MLKIGTRRKTPYLEKELRDGTLFCLRFLAVIVAMSNIHLILTDLRRVDWYPVPVGGFGSGVYPTSALFMMLQLFLITGVIWSFSVFVQCWLFVYTFTIPVSALIYGFYGEIPWMLGFSESAASFVVNKWNLDPSTKPAIAIIHGLLNLTTVFACYVYTECLKNHSRNTLPTTVTDAGVYVSKGNELNSGDIGNLISKLMNDEYVKNTLDRIARMPSVPGQKTEVLLPVAVGRSKS